jgi:ribosomal protein S18 acetylase RimI-like enzyme
MEIRTLNSGDAAAWWRIRLEAIESEPFAFSKSIAEHRATPVEEIARRFENAIPTTLNLGAFENETLVGIVTFMRESAEKERHKGRIYGVYVSHSHRGKGVARALLQTLLDRACADHELEQIQLAVATSQIAAQELYKSFGFKTYGTEPKALKVGSTYVDEEHMILVLPKRV